MPVLRIQEGRMFRQGKHDGNQSLHESPTFPEGLQKRQKILQETGHGMSVTKSFGKPPNL